MGSAASFRKGRIIVFFFLFRSPHPFVFMLNYEKGIKVYSRFLRFLQSEQILACFATILTRFECLEVSSVELGTYNKEIVDVFMNHVIPPFVAVISDSSLEVINSLFRIILERHNMQWFAKSRAGLSILTVVLSRAEILKSESTEKSSEQDLGMWSELYNFVFESLKGQFASLFPEKSSPLDELYLWQFLSAMAVGASGIEHQGILVTEVRDNVIRTAKSGDQKALDNVNLFMKALGLGIDASQLAEMAE